MIIELTQKLTLDRPATDQITVPGYLDENWAEWDGRMAVTIENESGRPPVTVLTGAVDQASLLGLLRRLYALGLPLISVICLELDHDEQRVEK